MPAREFCSPECIALAPKITVKTKNDDLPAGRRLHLLSLREICADNFLRGIVVTDVFKSDLTRRIAVLGAPIDIALRNFSTRVPLLDVRFFTSSVLLQKQTGGNLSEILSRLAYVIRERFRLKGQVKAASAHGRLTATILTLLPIATMLCLLFVAPGYLQGMAEDSDGKWLIGGAIVAQILGNFLIKKIINIKV